MSPIKRQIAVNYCCGGKIDHFCLLISDKNLFGNQKKKKKILYFIKDRISISFLFVTKENQI